MFDGYYEISYSFVIVSFLFHNHKLDSTIQQNLEDDKEKMEPTQVQREHGIIGYRKQTRMRGVLLSDKKEGLMVKIKCKSSLLEVSTVSNVHYRPGE